MGLFVCHNVNHIVNCERSKQCDIFLLSVNANLLKCGIIEYKLTYSKSIYTTGPILLIKNNIFYTDR